MVTVNSRTMNNEEEFEFGDAWHTENLPPFPLIEGETYLVPLKLLKKERRFDGGRGTEFYLFGDNERLGRYVSFSDKNIPQGIEQVLNEEATVNLIEALTTHKEISEELKQMAIETGKRCTFC